MVAKIPGFKFKFSTNLGPFNSNYYVFNLTYEKFVSICFMPMVFRDKKKKKKKKKTIGMKHILTNFNKIV